MKTPVVCIMANQRNGTLYVGVTSNIQRRVYEHRRGFLDGFTKIVFYEIHETMESAILREKQIKAGLRSMKTLFDWIAAHIKCARKDDRRSIYIALENFVYRV